MVSAQQERNSTSVSGRSPTPPRSAGDTEKGVEASGSALQPDEQEELSNGISEVTQDETRAPKWQETGRSVQHASQPISSVNDLSSVPDGGKQAWLQVLGSFFIFFNTWGIINTYGIYETTYSTKMLTTSSASDLAWIGSVQAFCLNFIGPFVGPLYDAGYFRIVIFVGSFFIVFGQMMLSLSTVYWEVFITQGICVGIGAGMLLTPGVAILSTYFNKNLAAAVGLAAAGSSLGGVIYPVTLYRLLPTVGFAWATRVVAFISLVTLAISNSVMRLRALPATRRKMFDFDAFTELPYTIFVFGSLFSWMGLYAPFFYVESYSISYGITSESLSFFSLAVINAGSFFGRILPNLLADKIGPLNVISPASSIAAVICLCLIPVRSLGPFFTLCVLYGFASGAMVSLPPTVFVWLSTHKRGMIGTRLGMGMFVSSLSLLIGTPACGWVLGAAGYTYLWIFGGVLLFTGGIGMYAAKVAKTRTISIFAKA